MQYKVTYTRHDKSLPLEKIITVQRSVVVDATSERQAKQKACLGLRVIKRFAWKYLTVKPA